MDQKECCSSGEPKKCEQEVLIDSELEELKNCIEELDELPHRLYRKAGLMKRHSVGILEAVTKDFPSPTKSSMQQQFMHSDDMAGGSSLFCRRKHGIAKHSLIGNEGFLSPHRPSSFASNRSLSLSPSHCRKPSESETELCAYWAGDGNLGPVSPNPYSQQHSPFIMLSRTNSDAFEPGKVRLRRGSGGIALTHPSFQYDMVGASAAGGGGLHAASGGAAGFGNLLRVRHASLGQSAPQLTPQLSLPSSSSGAHTSHGNAVMIGHRLVPQSSFRGASARRDLNVHRRHSHRLARRSFHTNTSPILNRCRSPILHASPADSPRGSPNPHAVKYAASHVDARRWSLASLPSSGYGTTPGSSALSSVYSSQERLCPMEDFVYGSNSSHSLEDACAEFLGVPLSPRFRPRSRSLSSMKGQFCDATEVVLRNNIYKDRFPKAKQQMEEKLEKFIAENGILSSSASTLQLSAAFQHQLSLGEADAPPGSPKAAARSRSGSVVASSSGSGGGSGSPVLLRQPSAGSGNSLGIPLQQSDMRLLGDGSARFVHHQIMETANDCLHKSHEELISSQYFYEMSQTLEDLLKQAKEKCPTSYSKLSGLVKKLLIIVARPARLLECLEFDPEQFYAMLEMAEDQVREMPGIREPIPQYIINKLGLNKDPMEGLEQNVESVESPSQETAPAVTPTTSTAAGATLERKTKGILKRSEATVFDSDCVDAGTGEEDANAAGVLTKRKQSNADIMRSRPPTEDDFETIKLISNGAYGAVYLVRHRETRLRFALKKINKLNLVLRNQLDQVFAERDILTFADNPFVVSFYGSFETKKHLCMVMEYVEGGDCATLLKNIGPFPLEMVRLYIAETLLAIEYLHSYGVVHRDIKPDNLLITALGHVKLTDFGLSKIGLMNRTNILYEGYIMDVSDMQQFRDKQVCGTPEYIAPEVILRQGYGKPVDYWALGIITYELLIGCVPFFGDTPEELFAHVISNAIEWPTGDEAPPEEAQDLIQCLLQQNPLDRLGTRDGAIEVKLHPFFAGVDWSSMLRQKAEFIPQLEGEDDTSYFDSRSDRYNHETESGEDELVYVEETNPLFASFSSSSPRYSLVADSASKNRYSLDASTALFPSSSSDPENDSSFRSLSSDATPPSIADSESGLAASLAVATAGAHHTRPHHPRLQYQASTGSTMSDVESGYARSLSEAGDENFCHSRKESLTVELEACEGVQRRRRTQTMPLPRLSISFDNPDGTNSTKELSPVEEKHSEYAKSPSSAGAESPLANWKNFSATTAAVAPPQFANTSTLAVPAVVDPVSVVRSSSSTATAGKEVPADATTASLAPSLPAKTIRSVSAQGLHLVIPSADASIASPSAVPLLQSPDASSTSSRDGSPSRCSGEDISPIIAQSNRLPVVVKRGKRGFGFTVQATKVFISDTDYYTLQHIITHVEPGSHAEEAGLHVHDLLTHVNGEPVQNLTHTQVFQLMMTGAADQVSLTVTPLESTSIKPGGPKRTGGKMVKRKGGARAAQKVQRRPLEKKSKSTSLFRRLSGKRASKDFSAVSGIAQMSVGLVAALPGLPGSRSMQALSRSISSCDALYGNTGAAGGVNLASVRQQLIAAPPVSPPSRMFSSLSDSSCSSPSTSSPLSSVPNSPAISVPYSQFHHGALNLHNSSRPSSLHVLKHKLANTLKSPRGRKHSQTMPLSPLARTDTVSSTSSAGSVQSSGPPARSPSPLAAGCMNAPSARPVGLSTKKTITKPRKSDPYGSPLFCSNSSGNAEDKYGSNNTGNAGAKNVSADEATSSSADGLEASCPANITPPLKRTASPYRLRANTDSIMLSSSAAAAKEAMHSHAIAASAVRPSVVGEAAAAKVVSSASSQTATDNASAGSECSSGANNTNSNVNTSSSSKSSSVASTFLRVFPLYGHTSSNSSASSEKQRSEKNVASSSPSLAPAFSTGSLPTATGSHNNGGNSDKKSSAVATSNVNKSATAEAKKQ